MLGRNLSASGVLKWQSGSGLTFEPSRYASMIEGQGDRRVCNSRISTTSVGGSLISCVSIVLWLVGLPYIDRLKIRAEVLLKG
jgi:hypothetical protein